MDRIVEHEEKQYLIRTTPASLIFAQVSYLRPRRATGIIANFLEAFSDQEQWTYDEMEISEEELIEVVLGLGHKFSSERAWKNLFDWAYFKKRRQRN